MGRATNYRAKIYRLIDNEDRRFNDLFEEDEVGNFEFAGSPNEKLDHEFEIKELDKVLRLLDALESAGVNEGPGFCREITVATGYSRSRVSNMLSGNAPLNSRFIKAICTAYGTNEEFILEGKGTKVTAALLAAKESAKDIAFTEAVSMLETMSEADRWRAVAVLKEMKANLVKGS
jgi:transcriptional regulator with XRE-family HTH domain